MKVLVINGSPKENSNTMTLTRAFLSGAGWENTEIVNVAKLSIHSCIGCFSCWNKTPGKCVFEDDMAQVLDKINSAEIIIWSFPLYYYSVPGALKNLIDRQLPLNLPFMTGEENGAHPDRYEKSRKHIVISTCGFYTTQGNYSAVDDMFTHYYGNFERLYCAQGELFRVPELRKRTSEYLETISQAGREYPNISVSTREKLDTSLFPKDVFEQMADASWGIEKPEVGRETIAVDESLTFTRQMAALYNAANFDKDRLMEMRYTDIGKVYQIQLKEKGATVLTERFETPTTVIETPFDVWKAIGQGEIEGSEALAQGKYRVIGDFSLMLKWEELFGTGKSKTDTPTAFSKRGKVINSINIGAAAMAAAFIISGANPWFVVGIELFFAIFWGITVFQKIPLTCYFSAGNYGGEIMLKNPIFTRTNRILTACWAIDFFLMTGMLAICTILDVPGWISSMGSYTLTPLLGIFTVFFQKWYPAKKASG
jgi:multimeric flavodoxin WrbA/putative sterol carrier protein